MNRRASNGERGRPGCTDRRLADLNNSVYHHGCSARRRTQQARRPRSPLIFRFMVPMRVKMKWRLPVNRKVGFPAVHPSGGWKAAVPGSGRKAR